MLRCSEALKLVSDEAPEVFVETRLDNDTLATSTNADMVLLLRAAQHYLTNPESPKEVFPAHAFYEAAAQNVNAFRALVLEMCMHNQSLITSSGFDGFLEFEINI